MWIRTQDKKQLFKITNISMTRNFGGKSRYALTVIIAGAGVYTTQSKVVGFYRTELDAIQELDKIQKQLESGKIGVYEIS